MPCCMHHTAQVEKAKIALIQFCVSPPKSDLENNVVVSDYTQMDRCALACWLACWLEWDGWMDGGGMRAAACACMR